MYSTTEQQHEQSSGSTPTAYTIHLTFMAHAHQNIHNYTIPSRLFTLSNYVHKRSPKVSVPDSYEKRRECFDSLFLSYYKEILKGFVYSLNIYIVFCVPIAIEIYWILKIIIPWLCNYIIALGRMCISFWCLNKFLSFFRRIFHIDVCLCCGLCIIWMSL